MGTDERIHLATAANYRVRIVNFTVARENIPARAGRPLLSEPVAVAALARQLIPDDAREHFGVFMLDAQNRLIAWHVVSTGTLSASLVHPREVLGPALRTMGVASLILVHNHPSGDPAPSREDIRLTRNLVEAARLLELTIHDHVILGDTDHVSLSVRGLL